MTHWIVNPLTDRLAGSVRVPGDKSISHRSLIFAGLGSGTSEIHGLSDGVDNRRTLTAMTQLGARFEPLAAPGSFRVTGVGVDGLTAPQDSIDCGNSGTSIRLLSGLLCGQSFTSTLLGDESLALRPMNRIAIPLRQMGADVRGQSGAKPDETYPALEVTGGSLRGIHYDSPISSAQVKSAVLLAGLYADGQTSVTEPKISRDHTERMLAGLGVPVQVDNRTVTIDPGSWDRKFAGSRFDVPGDPSSAAFILVAALVAGATHVEVGGMCANPTRTGILDALIKMNAALEIEIEPAEAGGEQAATVRIVDSVRGQLRGAVVSGELTVRAIDEIPVLAVAAACAEGVTEIRDGAELRVKESDRIATTAAMLRALGVDVDERSDGLIIVGRGGAPLNAGRVDAAGDHRIAMAAAVAALRADGPVRIDDVDNVATSFPGFGELFVRLGASLTVGEA